MRYAVYFAPRPETALARLGAHWLGRDAFMGVVLPQPAATGMDAALFAEATAEPARYGFHATLKPPFHLAEGATEKELMSAVEAFARHASPVQLDRIIVKRIGQFLALALANPNPFLDHLAAAVVERFDAFRAPPSLQEIERRKRSKLSPGQEAQLARWGYPYVMEEFRFHMSLTGAFDAAVLDRIEPAANGFFAEILSQPLSLDSISIFIETAPGAPFRNAAQWPLAGCDVPEKLGLKFSRAVQEGAPENGR